MVEMASQPYISGLTTNPTLMKKAGVRDYVKFAKEVLREIQDKPISFEVFSDDLEEMKAQGEKIASWGDNVFVKIPVTNTRGHSTQSVVRYLAANCVKVNVTAIMTNDQVARVQEQLYGNLETAMMAGTYAKSTSASVANAMGGIIPFATTGNTVAASSAQLEKAHINELLRGMASGGAKFGRMTIFANAFQKQKLSDIYSFVPTDRNVGGANIQLIETDFGMFEVVFSRFAPAATLLFADLAYCNVVTQPVPGKQYMPDGLFLMEQLSKVGATEKWQLYGQLSIDVGASDLHGTITGLAIA
jgi:hypothetical protein